ncbi:putative ATP-dependent RNA helicase YfmL [Halolactibacillus alkaliphilus]|uniref:Putative ATP-dependent RNA helicase YfmL n=1 Tax=Halolactibacillus alkaliphilus TaxID=442899 RepID=A0A511X1D2_9BACI|nr:DEAD/DEAH box helicase [Halolactibacillus alkaliphilus]GEN56759.1 putative ATP-dependent RNA helicase YfmL [Halolactibacillus alkaliphilus]GGN70813.1 putative ATP-dependent RNA helicase YfmL [Halolactibacillus alkaliphilus]SFO79805.1 Superfamily II DNA and RNA helicase [Halolactibacillus alkaliphilus]
MNELFKPFIHEALTKQGISELMPVQTRVMPYFDSQLDMIVTAPTGSGKTLAYLLPILNKLNEDTLDLQTVILASSHELVMQIVDLIQQLKEGSTLRAQALIGGANVKRQIEKLKKKPHIVVGTPGRMAELINQKKLKMHKVTTIVLDEVDQLITPDHLPAIDRVILSTDQSRHIACFSATVSNDARNVLAEWMNAPEFIQIKREELTLPDVTHGYILCEKREKFDQLRKLIHADKQKSLVFFNDIDALEKTYERLTYHHLESLMLHSDLNKDLRKNSIKSFKQGDSQVMLTTDVSSRGLDVDDLRTVIQMDIPREVNQYVHRAGRTGRLGSSDGQVISIVTKAEYQALKKITNHLKVQLTQFELSRGQLIKQGFHKG